MGTLKTVGDLKAVLATLPDDAEVIGLDSMRVETATSTDGSKEHIVVFRPAGVIYGREIEVGVINGDKIEFRKFK